MKDFNRNNIIVNEQLSELLFLLLRFSIVNLVKSDSLYNEGMRPLMYSNIEAKTNTVGWVRCGENISYYKNDDNP